ncbi:DUF1549 domain-containing protein, partial [candidate division KSB1 bacterium]|nr:DUF1549 domain-containing protein [candidate division KSB1 bacterium]
MKRFCYMYERENTPLQEGILQLGSPTLSSKIKIAHVVGRLSLGGLELEVIRLLNRLDPERYAATIIATESITPTARELVGKHIKLVALNKRAGMQWHVVREIAEWCRSQRITILHSHNWTTFLYSVLAGTRAGVPILIHGEHGRETHDYQPNLKQRLACQWLARRCEFITAVSEDIIPLLASMWKIPSRKIVKMPIGVALHEFDFTADRHVAKRSLGLPENAPVLGTIIGNFRPVKDLPTMLRAFQLLQREVPQAVLAVVGGGNLHVAEQQATDLGIASSVRFLGERRDVPRVLAAFDLYVNSSLYEGMSNAILEAMAAGVPVVATQVGGTPAIVPHDAKNSPLFRFVSGEVPELLMPPKSSGMPALTADEIELIRVWIDAGPNWPDEFAGGTAPAKVHWSLKPLERPAKPGAETNPIDAFIHAKLAENNLVPSPEADRKTLIRRLYFDLIGLPPTPEEVAAFAADTDGNAYEKIVDRLLASPRYGERWARHWLD